ncbi:unnamed protein product [Parascedosporium putredinis]|uniref:Ubiquitin/SUMO-activating enzyme ubiquitin-like domain-containing protein n=1 Tax=Parascedosporium putredinis TaxID=1442378 RepID=A0A9P1H8I2_9PEZI|nr:unnamed protein product [Parascedosporium putredinis]CAI7999450.1 unnamed protein product [Parascedosporium putredinis]
MLFDKVFDSDIERLRSMEDMWKSRKPPTGAKYDDVLSRATEALASKDALLRDGQRVWSLEESLVVFKDSLDRLSKRVLEMKANKQPDDPQPIITFDKDDEDTLTSWRQAPIFGRSCLALIESRAGLCVLQAFKVLKGDFDQAKEVFLTPFAPARLLASDRSRAPNPNCPVCSTYQTSAYVDMSRATLNDLVEDFVRLGLGYGDKEFILSNEVGILYDPDETENLGKKLSDLGIHKDSFLTIVDEDDDDTFVNVVVVIQDLEEPDEKPPKAEPVPEVSATNGTNGSNGVHAAGGPEMVVRSLKRSRADDDDEVAELKKAKKSQVDVKAGAALDDDVVVIEDEGAILIEDD